MAIKLKSFCLRGLDAVPVNVEVDSVQGMPNFSIGGMAGKSVQEAKDRVRSAISHGGFKFPMTRKVVNLSPAELIKHGTHFDLPIALGLIVASEQVKFEANDFLIAGELGLRGELQAVRGILPALMMAKEIGMKKVLIPWGNLREASLIDGLQIFAVKSLRECVEAVCGRTEASERIGFNFASEILWDFKNVAGHKAAKRAMMVAAAGGHHLLMKGPPGSGKSLLANSFPSILPRPDNSELLEILKIYSVIGKNLESISRNRPFRSVHHSVTERRLIGGEFGVGEVTLAHNGVLFLDELPEFSRSVIENLRQPLEEKTIGRKNYPCNFQLLAAMNPCPCGFYGDSKKACVCPPYQVLRYRQKISGPILDRIDIQIEVPRIPYDELSGSAETSAEMLKRVLVARDIAIGRSGHINSEMSPAEIKKVEMDADAKAFLKKAADKFYLSGRAIHKIIKVARTVADLEGESDIKLPQMAEGLQYRAG
mgnify:CR=1 FL=1